MRIEDSNYLVHYGIFGQKWGIRRFQNSDGTLTAEGKSRYRTDKVLNNVGRAFTNSSLGQRMDVNLNKGYRTDKKEIKGIYKEKKRMAKEMPVDKDSAMGQVRKGYLKQLKSDYKKTLGEARTAAAQANYNWQSDKTNEKIQTQKVGKTFLKSLLAGGGGGAMAYDNLTANDVNRGAAYLAGLGWNGVDRLTGGGASLAAYIGGKTGAIKSPNASVKNENNQAANKKSSTPKFGEKDKDGNTIRTTRELINEAANRGLEKYNSNKEMKQIKKDLKDATRAEEYWHDQNNRSHSKGLHYAYEDMARSEKERLQKEYDSYMKKRNSFKTDEEKDRWERQQELDRIKKNR